MGINKTDEIFLRKYMRYLEKFKTITYCGIVQPINDVLTSDNENPTQKLEAIQEIYNKWFGERKEDMDKFLNG